MNTDLIDLSASFYDKNSNLQNNLAKEVLKAYQVNPRAYILDVGCGDGKITLELAKLAKEGKALGIDSSPSMIQFASTHFPKTDFPNLSFAKQKAEDITLPQQFDLITSFSCLHWIRNPELAFQQLSASLKPGGEMLILTYPKESPYYQYFEAVLKKYPEHQALSAYNTMLSVEGYRDVLSKNNLDVLNFQQCDFIASYSNANELKDFIKGWLNSYVPLPEDLHEQFLQDICQAVAEDPKAQDGDKTIIPYAALIIRAKKN